MVVDPRRQRRWRDLVVDCAVPAPLARFWAAALRWDPPVWDEDDLADLRALGIDDPEGDPSVFIHSDNLALPRICFQKVPEAASAKSGKTRIHLDVNVDSPDEMAELVALGATVLAHHQGQEGDWWVLTDPEGNEFCAVMH